MHLPKTSITTTNSASVKDKAIIYCKIVFQVIKQLQKVNMKNVVDLFVYKETFFLSTLCHTFF